MLPLLDNQNLNGFISFALSLAGFVILFPIALTQIKQFRQKRLFKLKVSLLSITVIAIFTTIPAIVLQFEKFSIGTYPDWLASVSSICNGVSRLVLAGALAVIYYQNYKSK